MLTSSYKYDIYINTYLGWEVSLMQFAGMQKLTLLDFPGTVACILFTRGCNYRCPFCHNALLVEGDGAGGETYTEEDIISYLKKRSGMLEGVSITGGEPTLYSELPQFIRKVKAEGYRVKLDTNGTNPDMVRELINENLVDYVAMDVKNSPALYARTAGLEGKLDAGSPLMKKVEMTRDILLEGRADYEFRTTLVKGLHTPESVEGAAAWISGAKAYYLQDFKDSGQLIAPEGLSAFSEAEMKEFAEIARKYVSNTSIRGI